MALYAPLKPFFFNIENTLNLQLYVILPACLNFRKYKNDKLWISLRHTSKWKTYEKSKQKLDPHAVHGFFCCAEVLSLTQSYLPTFTIAICDLSIKAHFQTNVMEFHSYNCMISGLKCLIHFVLIFVSGTR